jgi:cytochrome c oxidase cbb3-type subunit III
MRPATPRNESSVATRIASWTAAIAIALLAGCDPPGKPNPSDRPVPPQDVVNFDALFKRNCAGCHGADGTLGPAPPLRDPLFRAGVPERELERVINSGRPGTPMPAFALANGGTLTPLQIQVLVYEIKGVPYTLAPGVAGEERKAEQVRDGTGTTPQWGSPKPMPQMAPSCLVSEHRPIRSSSDCEQIRKTVFARACADCHGEDGRGGGSAGAINEPSFLALISDQALRRLIITGRPDLEMPDYAHADGRDPDFRPLTSQEVDDLVDLLAFWRTSGKTNAEPDRQTAKK